MPARRWGLIMLLFLLDSCCFWGCIFCRPSRRACGTRRWRRSASFYRIVHSVLSIATLCLLIYGFGEARLETGILYDRRSSSPISR